MCDKNYNFDLLIGASYEGTICPNVISLELGEPAAKIYQIDAQETTQTQCSPPDAGQPDEPVVDLDYAGVKKSSNSRTRNPDMWKAAVRKRLRQKGESYVDSKGNEQRARKVQAPCTSQCRLQCQINFPASHREKLHLQFWTLTDEQKWQYYAIYVERCAKERNRSKQEQSRRIFTYNYYLKNKVGRRVKVCKTFFLNTLDISSKRLYFFYENVMQESGIPRQSLKGKLTHRSTLKDQTDFIVNHIRSFDRLPPPKGVVSSSSLEFLDAKISIRKMYEMYKELYGDQAVKEHFYRSVLKSNFNIVFIKS